MELNQGFPFMENIIVKTYFTPFLKPENIFNISDFFFCQNHHVMYVCVTPICKKKMNMYLYECLTGSVHGVG